MFPITITLHNPAQLNAVLAALGTAPAPALDLPQISAQHAAADDTAGLEPAPAKKSKATSVEKAAPAPTPRTAKAEAAAAPEKTAAASAPSAPSAANAAQASTAAVDYAELSKAVLKLMKLDSAAAAPIAKALGFETFKQMKEAENAGEVFAKALAAVNEKLAELETV